MENVKMRHVYEGVCNTCGCNKNQCLDLFEIGFVNHKTGKTNKLTMCDECVEKLFYKTLKAVCSVNHKVKSKEEIAIINRRMLTKCTRYTHIPINPPEGEKDDEWDKVLEELENKN